MVKILSREVPKRNLFMIHLLQRIVVLKPIELGFSSSLCFKDIHRDKLYTWHLSRAHSCSQRSWEYKIVLGSLRDILSCIGHRSLVPSKHYTNQWGLLHPWLCISLREGRNFQSNLSKHYWSRSKCTESVDRRWVLRRIYCLRNQDSRVGCIGDKDHSNQWQHTC